MVNHCHLPGESDGSEPAPEKSELSEPKYDTVLRSRAKLPVQRKPLLWRLLTVVLWVFVVAFVAFMVAHAWPMVHIFWIGFLFTWVAGYATVQ